MKVSVWQQFSSNHSANFTVVGEFESPARAQAIADELLSILTQIGQFWETLSPQEFNEWETRIDNGDITPPEEILREQYGIEWIRWPDGRIQGIDWVKNVTDAKNAVSVFHNFAVVSCPFYYATWAGHKPFDEIMNQRGGTVAVDLEGSLYIDWDVSFSAPDETVADIIQKSFNSLSTERGKNWPENQYEIVAEVGNWPLIARFVVQREGLNFRLTEIYLYGEKDLVDELGGFETYLTQIGAENIRFKTHMR